MCGVAGSVALRGGLPPPALADVTAMVYEHLVRRVPSRVERMEFRTVVDRLAGDAGEAAEAEEGAA